MIEKILLFFSSIFSHLLSYWQNRESLKLGGVPRSPLWRMFRQKQIILRGGKCELCGGTELLELHHIEPFHKNPVRELDPTNVMILCESGKNGIVCHRGFGHLGNYQSININVEADVREWRLKIQNRP